MADTQPGKGGRTVPVSDLLAVKNQLKKAQAELEASKVREADALAQLQVSTLNIEDDAEVSKVRKYLLQKERELATKEVKISQTEATLTERERSARAKELATEYGIDVESLTGEDDMEKVALRLNSEKLAKELEEAKS